MEAIDTLSFLRDLVILFGSATLVLTILYVIATFRKDDE